MIPYRPDARGQGRGNSGFYMVHLYEVQILDSFGPGASTTNAAASTKNWRRAQHVPAAARLADLRHRLHTSAELKDGKKVAPAKITLAFGVVVQDTPASRDRTGGSRNEPEGTPGPFILQGHDNPLSSRTSGS